MIVCTALTLGSALSTVALVRSSARADAAATPDCTKEAVSGGPYTVRVRLIADGDFRYRFDPSGRPRGCVVTFDESAAISIAKLILTGRSANVTLGARNGRLVHVAPRERSLVRPTRRARAWADARTFLTLLTHGSSIAACTRLSADALFVHGGRAGCIMAFESAKFTYREHYAGAGIERIALFELGSRSYALATIARRIGTTRAIFVLERGRYRYLGDFSRSPIELW